MREIKFRAWDKKEKKMIYEGKIDQWKDDYGDEDYTRVHIHFDGSLSGHISDDGGKNGFWEHDAGLKKDRLILLQFTGLKDKNGREIYEGDILELIEPEIDGKQTEFGRVVVKFGKYDTRDIESGDISLGWYVEGRHGYKRMDNTKDDYEKLDSLLRCQGSKWKKAWEIVGNIYENPELLGGDGGGLA